MGNCFGKNNEKEGRIQELDQENTTLKERIQELEQENNTLKNEMEEVNAQVWTLKCNLSTLGWMELDSETPTLFVEFSDTVNL